MSDQADELRDLVRRMEAGGWQASESPRSRAGRRSRVFAVASGKGGVGKSSLSLNLALALSASGQRTLLVDADLGLASIDILLGVRPERTLAEVALDDVSVEEALLHLPGGLDLLPGAAGVAEMADLAPVARQRLVAALEGLEDEYDFVVVDVAAGVGEGVRGFLRAADRVIVVTTGEPTAVTDAYALVKLLVAEGHSGLGLAVNMARSPREGDLLAAKVAGVARRFLGAEIAYLGSVPFDWQAGEAVRERRPLLVGRPFSPASQAIRKMAQSAARWAPPAGSREGSGRNERGGIVALFRRAVGM